MGEVPLKDSGLVSEVRIPDAVDRMALGLISGGFVLGPVLTRFCSDIQGYLAHENQLSPLGPP